MSRNNYAISKNSFKAVEHPKLEKSTFIYFHSNTNKPITENDIENIKNFLPNELLSCGIDNPMNLTNYRKKFDYICSISNEVNFCIRVVSV